MRLTADVLNNSDGIKRLMIYASEDGVYFFGFDKLPDGGGLFDEWYETIADAKASASEAYQVPPDSWFQIADPMEHCQHDWIQPVRIKGRDTGNPKWGKYERLVNGAWEDFDPKE